MNDDLESQLRAALRPVAPKDGFEQRLLARLEAGRRPAPRRPPRVLGRARAAWLSAGLAAALLAAVGIGHRVQQNRERAAGLEARREVLEALRVTNQKLDLAYRAVRAGSAPDTGDAPGA